MTQNDQKALIAVGDMLRLGKVVAADPGRAVGFYVRAADAGNGGAAITAGFMFARGQGIAEDLLEPSPIWKRALPTKKTLGRSSFWVIFAPIPHRHPTTS